jgi:GT2 family glycosyltransferase
MNIKTLLKKITLLNIKKTLLTLRYEGVCMTLYKIQAYLSGRDLSYIKPIAANYNTWIEQNEPTPSELEKQRKESFKYSPKLSVVVPMYNTDKKFLDALVTSLIEQTYSNWELCLADGSPQQNPALQDVYKQDPRIKYHFIGENKGISGNTNEAIKMSTGDFIGLLDHDDTLPPFSLYEVVKCINENPTVEFIYSDEDKIDITGEERFGPHFKPDFSPDFLRANNYICHFSVFKRSLMDKLGGERSKYDGAQDFDLVIRASEETTNIVHIPKVLYHWRAHPNSTAQAKNPVKSYAFEAGIAVVQDHLQRLGWEGTVSHGRSLGTYRTVYKVIGEPTVSIIIPNKDGLRYLKKCITSILQKTTYKNYEILIVENNSTDPKTFNYYKKLEKNKKIKVLHYPEKGFNYSKIINFGVRHSEAEFVVQLNNDTQIKTPSWLEEMLGFAQREDVGAVGAKLLYPYGRIQHAGIVFGIHTVAGHLFKGLPTRFFGYFRREDTIQNFSAVTGACLMSRKSIYPEVGYMDETFPVAFNDLDFCLKIRELGKLIVYNPFVELIHDESKTRGYEDSPEKQKRFNEDIKRFLSKWYTIYEKGDPYYNKNFSLDSLFYEIRIDDTPSAE